MVLKKWEDLPDFMRIPEVKPYYEVLEKKKISLFFKRVFDLVIGIILLVLLSPVFLLLAIAIKIDSKGPVFYRQIRVTQYGKEFRIHKFRTMCEDADKIGTLVTVDNDPRITRVGKIIRKIRLDETSQVLDIISGNMSFIGTRPEAVKYVNQYKPEYNATLLLPAGLTSEASIRFKDEEKLISEDSNIDDVYLNQILPSKMLLNLKGINSFCLKHDILTIFRTMFTVLVK